MTSVIDGYVANALAGPNLQPFWAAAYAGFIGRDRAVHDFLGEPPPTIERIAVLAAREAELAALLDRLTPLRSPSGQPLLREDLEQWYRTAWLRLDPALRARIAAGLRRAADAVAAVRVCSAPLAIALALTSIAAAISTTLRRENSRLLPRPSASSMSRRKNPSMHSWISRYCSSPSRRATWLSVHVLVVRACASCPPAPAVARCGRRSFLPRSLSSSDCLEPRERAVAGDRRSRRQSPCQAPYRAQPDRPEGELLYAHVDVPVGCRRRRYVQVSVDVHRAFGHLHQWHVRQQERRVAVRVDRRGPVPGAWS